VLSQLVKRRTKCAIVTDISAIDFVYFLYLTGGITDASSLGWWPCGHHLEIQTYTSHGDCFYVLMKSISFIVAVDFLQFIIFTSISAVKKHDFYHLQRARIFWPVEKVEN
jgi:hypothetical protein